MSRDDQNRLNAADQQVESLLASFVPAAPAVDRDRLMFEAGWQAALASLENLPARQSKLSRYAWPAATALATAASVMLAVMLVRQPEQVENVAQMAPREEVQEVTVDPAPPTPEPEAIDEARLVASPPALPWPFRSVSLAGDNYLAVRSAVLETGLSALRPSEPTMTSSDDTVRPPVTMRSLMDEYLPTSRATSDSNVESEEEPMGHSLSNQEHLS